MHLNIGSRRKKQTKVSEQNNSSGTRVKNIQEIFCDETIDVPFFFEDMSIIKTTLIVCSIVVHVVLLCLIKFYICC